jgi:hypothetical protein
MKPYPNFRDLERHTGTTWSDMTALEPRLAELLWSARQACSTCRRWSDVDELFRPIGKTLTELVGFAGRNHRHPILGGAGAYQVAYWRLYDAVAATFNAGNGETQTALPSLPVRPAAKPRRRFNRRVGFWLGGTLLGVGGCILGASMAYPHPVGITISVLWWTIYLGCLGASIGALLGLWTEKTPSCPPEESLRNTRTSEGDNVAEAESHTSASDKRPAAA